MPPTYPSSDQAVTALPTPSAAQRREDSTTGSLAIVGGALILVGASTSLLLYSALAAGWLQRPLVSVLFQPGILCFWTGHGLLGGLAIVIGMRAFRGRPGDGTGLFLIGLAEMPAWVLFFGGPIALAGGVVLLVAGIHARVTSYPPRGSPLRL